MLLFLFGVLSLLLCTVFVIEMIIFLASAVAIWSLVLILFMLRDWRLLLRVMRWSAAGWLLIFGLVVSEVLREGLIINGEDPLHWGVRFTWSLWLVVVVCSFLDWRFLLPAATLPILFFAQPEVQTLLSYGLARLGWTGVVHSPFIWLTTQTRMLEFTIHTRTLTDKWIGRLLLPMVRTLNRFLDSTASTLFWSADESWEAVRAPPPRWTLLPFAWYLY